MSTNQGLSLISYRATLDVSRALAQYVATLLSAERRQRGTRTGVRKLRWFWQAVVGFVGSRPYGAGEVTCDHTLSRATADRSLDEVIDVLVGQVPDVEYAVQQARKQQLAYSILDGAVITADRFAEKTMSVQGKSIDLWYSGKAHCHGGNIQSPSPRTASRCGSPGSNLAVFTT